MGWIAWDRFAVMEMFGGQHEQSLLIDKASLLNQEQMNGIAKYHSAFLDAYDIDFRVVTTTGAEDINLYSVKSFEGLQVGTFSTTRRGLLLVVDPENDLVRMEIGRSLEGVYTDASIPMHSSPILSNARWCRSFRPIEWQMVFWQRPSCLPQGPTMRFKEKSSTR